MKIDKKLIKELVDHLKDFNLTELEYQDGQTKIKVSKASKAVESFKTGAVVSPNKSVLKNSEDSEGTRIKSPIIGTAYFPVAAGSPGPLDKNMPFGFNFNIFSTLVLHETILTLQLKSEKYLRIFFFIP